MERTICIRKFKEEDKQGLVGLLSSFYTNITCIKDWENLYMLNPEGKAIISSAEDVTEKRIVGHLSIIRLPLLIFGRKYKAGKGEGEMFDLKFLKKLMEKGFWMPRGISTNLVKYTLENAIKEDIELVCTNPNNLALKSHLESGYEALKHKFSIFVLLLNRKYLIHLLIRKIKLKNVSKLLSFPIFYLLKLVFFVKTFCYRFTKIELIAFNSFDNTTDNLAKESGLSDVCIMIEPKHTHMNWRFGSENYQKFFIKSRDKIIGYTVIHIFNNPNGFKEANIVDYLLLDNKWGEFRKLIVTLVNEAKRNGCELLRVNYMHDHKEQLGISRVFKTLGFLQKSDQRNIVIFLSENLRLFKNSIMDIKNWHFTDLYFEGY